MVEWLSWLPCKSGFINFDILETSKGIANSPPTLKLLKQCVHESVGGSTEFHPTPLDNVVGSKRLRSGRVKEI